MLKKGEHLERELNMKSRREELVREEIKQDYELRMEKLRKQTSLLESEVINNNHQIESLVDAQNQ